MAKTTKKRWSCPVGQHPGCLAPARMRAKDIRRFCLPCSQERGVLVERTCPALEAEREARKAKRAARRSSAAATKRRSKERAAESRAEARKSRLHIEGIDLGAVWAAMCQTEGIPERTRKSPPRLEVQGGSRTGGLAYYGARRCYVGIGKSVAEILSTMAHELAHIANWDFHDGDYECTDSGRPTHHGTHFHRHNNIIRVAAFGADHAYTQTSARMWAGSSPAVPGDVVEAMRERFPAPG